MNNKTIKNIILHIKYPYTALVISIMWISMTMIISSQGTQNLEVLILATAVCTLIIAVIGFKTPK